MADSLERCVSGGSVDVESAWINNSVGLVEAAKVTLHTHTYCNSSTYVYIGCFSNMYN